MKALKLSKSPAGTWMARMMTDDGVIKFLGRYPTKALAESAQLQELNLHAFKEVHKEQQNEITRLKEELATMHKRTIESELACVGYYQAGGYNV